MRYLLEYHVPKDPMTGNQRIAEGMGGSIVRSTRTQGEDHPRKLLFFALT
jgi:hypothetical protein